MKRRDIKISILLAIVTSLSMYLKSIEMRTSSHRSSTHRVYFTIPEHFDTITIHFLDDIDRGACYSMSCLCCRCTASFKFQYSRLRMRINTKKKKGQSKVLVPEKHRNAYIPCTNEENWNVVIVQKIFLISWNFRISTSHA